MQRKKGNRKSFYKTDAIADFHIFDRNATLSSGGMVIDD